MRVCMTLMLVALAQTCGVAATDDADPRSVDPRSVDPRSVVFRVEATGVVERGLRPLSGGDGVTALVVRGGSRCLTTQEGTTPPSNYIYFDVDDAWAKAVRGPVYAVVEYCDVSEGGVIQINYDSNTGDELGAKYLPDEDQWGGWLTGDMKWARAVLLLEKPLFNNRQNLGADFRLDGSAPLIRSVTLTLTKPDFCDQLARAAGIAVKPRVQIGRGGQLIIGEFDPGRRDNVLFQTRRLRAAAPMLKALGFTSHESYVQWNLCEPELGRYDWSVYDAYVKIYKQFGLKWVPFLIVGSPYSLPDWYYRKPESQGYVCLEHGQESDVQSLWNPHLRGHVARFIQAFCDHYRDSGVIESILLGITGNYGEAIYVATGNDWTANLHGEYHTHPGYWACDPYAVQNFQQWLAGKYRDASALSRAWGKAIEEFGAVKPFLRDEAPNDRAWLDFVDWYIGSMTDWARFWLTETRRNCPKGDIYLCTGGHAPPEHGANFSDQCKVAAEVRGGVRITNEGSDYNANFSLTRWVASAGRQYGAYFSFEPAGAVDPPGVIARIYNATASGARGLHYYYGNVFAAEAARENFVRWGNEFKQRKPAVEIAVYYPQTDIKLKGNKFLDYVQPLRDRFDFDYMCDEQIRDGGLDHIKALILLWGNTSEADVWNAITNWVKKGGLLLYPDGMGRLRTVEPDRGSDDERVHETLFGAQADRGVGRVATFSGEGNTPEYRAFLSRKLADAHELSPATRAMVAADGQEDHVFVTLCDRNKLLWLNYTAEPVSKAGCNLPPYSITQTKAKRAR